MICPKCGAKLEEGTKVCPICGKNLVAVSVGTVFKRRDLQDYDELTSEDEYDEDEDIATDGNFYEEDEYDDGSYEEDQYDDNEDNASYEEDQYGDDPYEDDASYASGNAEYFSDESDEEPVK